MRRRHSLPRANNALPALSVGNRGASRLTTSEAGRKTRLRGLCCAGALAGGGSPPARARGESRQKNVAKSCTLFRVCRASPSTMVSGAYRHAACLCHASTVLARRLCVRKFHCAAPFRDCVGAGQLQHQSVAVACAVCAASARQLCPGVACSGAAKWRGGRGVFIAAVCARRHQPRPLAAPPAPSRPSARSRRTCRAPRSSTFCAS